MTKRTTASKRAQRTNPGSDRAAPRKRLNGFAQGADEPNFIVVKGAREHNLHIDEIAIPKRQLVVFTGLSGSGKSSLAFDTIYAEGQRRYVESLSSYARQFLGQMEKPKYDQIRGLSPTIAIEQKSASSNPRSTVGTVTEIYDYLRVLYARAGEQRCPTCGGPAAGRSAAEIVAELLGLDRGTKLLVLAPKVQHRKGEFRDLFEAAQEAGFVRVRVDGTVYRLEEAPALSKKHKHSIEIVIDRLTIADDQRARLTDSVETALREAEGSVGVLVDGEDSPRIYSENRSCPKCNTALPELTPQLLSYNSPLGMCGECNGLGTRLEVDPDLLVTDTNLSLEDGCLEPWRNAVQDGESGWTARIAKAVTESLQIDMKRPWKKLTARQKELLLYGTDKRIDVKWKGKHGQGSWAMKWEGLANQLMRRFQATQSETMRSKYQRYLRQADCRGCNGKRLRREAQAVFVGGRSITEVVGMTVADAAAHFRGLELTGAAAVIAEEVLKEIGARLGFLLNVGLDYLTLDRSANTLSGGEAQRIRLASQLGSELSGVMYVLDEPSIGLHQRDNERLIQTLERLRDLGNSVLVVEHDEEMIRSANCVIDFGPGAGKHGGQIVAQGTAKQIEKKPASVTGRYLSGREMIAVPTERRTPAGMLTIRGARENNLDGVDVALPLGVLCAVTGVSGAGKSSLINQILHPALKRKLHKSMDRVGLHDDIEGIDDIDKVIDIDQQPIGRTPRSNPATYTKAFDMIRDVFASTPEARAFGFAAGRFSFNVKGGRCEACEGGGVREVEMHFLPNVYVTCPVCKGRRYNEATLRVRFKGKSIADVLDMSIVEALDHFSKVPGLVRILKTLEDVGLGYVALGQRATTLSGGEAQRIKLARELAKRDTGKTLYILDEPTTGLHFADVKKLLEVLQRLVSSGNSVLVIEHNLDVIKVADWIVDLGPEGGAKGGRVIAEGTPEAVARARGSYTGQYLLSLLPAPAAKRTNKRAAKPATTRRSPRSAQAT